MKTIKNNDLPKLDYYFQVNFFDDLKSYNNISNQIIAISRPTIIGATLISYSSSEKVYDLLLEEAVIGGEIQFEFQEDVSNGSVIDMYDLMDGNGFSMFIECFDGNKTTLDRMTLKECCIIEVSSSELDYVNNDDNSTSLTKVVSVNFKYAEHIIYTQPTIN